MKEQYLANLAIRKNIINEYALGTFHKNKNVEGVYPRKSMSDLTSKTPNTDYDDCTALAKAQQEIMLYEKQNNISVKERIIMQGSKKPGVLLREKAVMGL